MESHIISDTDQLRNLVRKRGHQDFAAQPLELFQQPVSIRGWTSGLPESPVFDDRRYFTKTNHRLKENHNEPTSLREQKKSETIAESKPAGSMD